MTSQPNDKPKTGTYFGDSGFSQTGMTAPLQGEPSQKIDQQILDIIVDYFVEHGDYPALDSAHKATDQILTSIEAELREAEIAGEKKFAYRMMGVGKILPEELDHYIAELDQKLYRYNSLGGNTSNE